MHDPTQETQNAHGTQDALAALRERLTAEGWSGQSGQESDAAIMPDALAASGLDDEGGTGEALAKELAGAVAEALIASGALDGHIERIVRHVLGEYDAQENIFARRGGGYRPGVFGSIG